MTQGPLGDVCPARAAARGYAVRNGSRRALKSYIKVTEAHPLYFKPQ